MGNQASALTDGETAKDAAARQLVHFDHTFKCEIHSISGPPLQSVFGACTYSSRPAVVTCKGSCFELLEERGISDRKYFDVQYADIGEISWDHANSAVKLVLRREGADDGFCILTMANSIEFEQEMKLRLSSSSAGRRRAPTPLYVGMFAGATKPKPFQRKRPNITRLPTGKLPPLNQMRVSALELHRGSYSPCPPGESRRLELAVQHIYEGHNHFALTYVRGMSDLANQWRPSSILVINELMIVYKAGSGDYRGNEFPFEDIDTWTIVDNEALRPNDSGINIHFKNGQTCYFGVMHLRDLKHTLEYYWNKYRVANNLSVMPGSTHGRPLETVHTLSGEVKAPPAPVGSIDVVDENGAAVRPGQLRVKVSQGAAVSSFTSGPKVPVQENFLVKKHWHSVVKHQGWLLKKGGVGVGAAKQWLKRYFVLYGTSQGHFMVYYGDFTECPLYCTQVNHRNVVDLAKATYIRPGSNKAEFSDTPPHSFDIVTTEREWTLCAESLENMQRWMKMITRAVDEDVSILPDEELLFKVKAKADPTGTLHPNDYSTSVKISAFGVSVCTPDSASNRDVEKFFWIYTDFYKWSLLSQNGKLALLVNVFSDSSFSKRQELVFRSKEAVRLATAIEFFIEKFMSIMHVRLELENGYSIDEGGQSGAGGGLHGVGADEWQQDEIREVEGSDDGMNEPEPDLLGFDMDSTPVGYSSSPSPFASASSAPPAPVNHSQNAFSNTNTMDLLGDSLLDLNATKQPHQQQQSNEVDLFGLPLLSSAPAPSAPSAASNRPVEVDLFGLPIAPAPAPAAPPTRKTQEIDIFGLSTSQTPAYTPPAPPATDPLDLLGMSMSMPTTSQPPATASASNPFDLDPFGLSTSTTPPPTTSTVKVAPPLTNDRISQHRVWLLSALGSGGGPIYDDGSLQIASKLETRGSQARLTLFLRNPTPGTLENFSLVMDDTAGLLRFESGPVPSTLGGLAQAQSQIMLECMKPASPGPSLLITYKDTLIGQRSEAIPLPVVVTSFNEPVNMPPEEFTAKWQQLVAPGLEESDVLIPSSVFNHNMIAGALSSILKFGRVSGLPDDGGNTLYGAATLKTGALSAPRPGTATGDKINVGCLIKIEINMPAKAIRITVRTLHPAATSAVMQTARFLLA